MPFNHRMLIGMNGLSPDVHLIRYASMVARLESAKRLDGLHTACASGDRALLAGSLASVATDNEPTGSRVACESSRPSFPDSVMPEIRFVCLLPKHKRARQAAAAIRGQLRDHVHTYFTGAAQPVVVGCDLLKGESLQRLSRFALDFDSDLLLLSDAPWPRRHCGRVAVTAPCPVWLVPPAWAPVLRRVLTPTDFSSHSAECVRVACGLLRHAPGAKCVALHVYRHEGRFTDEASVRATRSELIEQFRDFLRPIDTQGVAVEPVLVESHFVDRTIAREAHRHSADLVIMSSREHTAAAGLVHAGITQRAIRQSRVSFLVLKSAGAAVGFWQALRERIRSGDTVQFS